MVSGMVGLWDKAFGPQMIKKRPNRDIAPLRAMSQPVFSQVVTMPIPEHHPV